MIPSPLYQDPIYGAPTDPVIVWNREEKQWWILYTQRRRTFTPIGASDVHGSDIGVASSADGRKWLYRGTLPNLAIEPGHNTFWAPEIFFAEGKYHMYVSYITGIAVDWEYPRHILHYTADNMWEWKYEGALQLSSERVIDACVFEVEKGRYKMWYKDENHESHSYAAESTDLYNWTVVGDEVNYNHHEGPNVFRFAGKNWMITDEWDGLGVYTTEDFCHFERNGVILKEGGSRPMDQMKGHHADVLVQGDNAYIFYFCHPGEGGTDLKKLSPWERGQAVVQAAVLKVVDGKLVADRDADIDFKLEPGE